MNQQQLREIFIYKDGNLYWKNPYKATLPGKAAGTLHPKGYKYIKINSQQYAAHRLIFLYHHGHLPTFIDHINNIRDDNRIENLREASSIQNNQNAKKRKDNTSGVKGVVWHKRDKKWQAQLRVYGKYRYFGLYYDKDYAAFVIEAIRHKYHKQFARNI